MPRITIVFATSMEIEPLTLFLKSNGHELGASKYSIQNTQVDLLQTGIGSLLTMYQLMNHLATDPPRGWIQMGIGGALDPACRIGDVFQVNSERIYGEGAEDIDGSLMDPFMLGWMEPNTFPFQDKELKCPYHTAFNTASGMTTFHALGEAEHIEKVKHQPHGQIENMEGAPFFYVSLMKQIPFLSFRGISNIVEPRDKSKWDIPGAVRQLNSAVIQFLEEAQFQPERLFVRNT